MAIIPGVTCLSTVLPQGGRVPAEEQLVYAVGHEQEHSNHQQTSRVPTGCGFALTTLLAVRVVLVLVSRESAEETRG